MSKGVVIMKKNIIVYVVTIILSLAYIFLLNNLFLNDLDLFQNKDVVKARVLEIISSDVNEYHLGLNDVHEEKTIYFEAKILSGNKKGEIVEAAQQINDIYAGNHEEVKAKDKILLMGVDYFENADYLMTEFVRSDSITIFCIIFMLFLLIFGHKKGINTIISLVFTCLAIFLVFIPAVLSGHNIYLWSIITCLFIIVMTLLLINNLSKKTLCAMMSCIVGVTITAILTVIMTKIMHLTGLVDEQSYYIQLMDTENPFDLKAIIFGGIIIGAVGAIMDVAVELSASLLEVYEKARDTDKTVKSLWSSGVNIGRDMMGTMSNTLILAFAGGSLNTLVFIFAYNYSYHQIINMYSIGIELMQGISASMGVILTVPFTSLAGAFFISGKVLKK